MTTIDEVRTYGGWRRARGIGLAGLGPVQTVILLAAIVVPLVSASISFQAFAVTAPAAALLAAGMLIRWDGTSLSMFLLQRLRWLIGTSRGYTAYRSGVMAPAEYAWQLPGVLAPTTVIDVPDPTGSNYGAVWDKRRGTLTVTLRCAAASTWLANPGQTDAWVANWGNWLASLGYQPMVDYVAITVDTAPGTGTRLTDYMVTRMVPTAPLAARRVLQQLVAAAPAASADVETRLSITFRPAASPAKPRSFTEALDEVTRALPGLQDSLALCGVTILGRATAGQLAAMMRVAFDPAARGAVARLPHADIETWLTWKTSGPVAAEELRDRYRHDGAVSVSWAMHEPPRQRVQADVLARLVTPGRYPKRVTLMYRPMSAGQAAGAVEKEHNAAQFRSAVARAKKKDQTARDSADMEHARQAAHEEAVGAGVGAISIVATVTVEDEADLGRAIADIESRGEAAKVRLRRLHHSQAAGFAATLPAGICLPVLATYFPR